jgi:hypothetical protein
MLQYDELLEAVPRLTKEWVAGFFDGEGTVGAYDDGVGGHRINVSITQKDAKILALLAMKFPEMSGPAKVTGKDAFYIRASGHSGKRFLEFIKDHVICKRKEVELALEFIMLLGTHGGGTANSVHPKNLARRVELAGLMKQAKEQD